MKLFAKPPEFLNEMSVINAFYSMKKYNIDFPYNGSCTNYGTKFKFV